MALTAVTVAVAFVDLDVTIAGMHVPLNPVIALVIATCKALLVILWFMHVRYSTRLTWIVVIAGFFWLGILLALTMSDYISRGWLGTPTIQ
jgi:cytochrome c oxidase subunit 4